MWRILKKLLGRKTCLLSELTFLRVVKQPRESTVAEFRDTDGTVIRYNAFSLHQCVTNAHKLGIDTSAVVSILRQMETFKGERNAAP